VRAYTVRRAPPELDVVRGWHDAAWASAPPLDVAAFRPESSDHRPRTQARLVYSEAGLVGIFRVEDRYLRSVHSRFQDPVYEDSCVEVFLQPKPGRGYLNLEMNAGGTLLASHVTDERRTPGGLAALRKLTDAEGRRVRVRSSLPPVVDPEIVEPVDWELAFSVPTDVLEGCFGPIGTLAGQQWRANLYKCGDKTSHPHWAAWSPVDELNFHLPRCFGRLRFVP
jgi:hypothetical protein